MFAGAVPSGDVLPPQALSSFHYTLKRTSAVAGRATSPAVIQTRVEYAAEYLTVMTMRECIYHIERTGLCASMRMRGGRFRVEERAFSQVPVIWNKNISLCAVYNVNSMFYFSIQNRPYGTMPFVAFIKTVLVSFIERSIAAVILVMDNISFHHSRVIRALVEGAGHRLIFATIFTISQPNWECVQPMEALGQMFSTHKLGRAPPFDRSKLLGYYSRLMPQLLR